MRIRLAGAAGFEPANAGTKNRCLTTWRRPSSRRAYSGRGARGKASGVRQPSIDQVEIVLAHRPGELADLEAPGADRVDGRHLRRAAGQEALLEALQLLRPDRPLDHLDAATA